SANVYAQRLNLNIRKQLLTEVLQELRKQSGYAFVYRDSDLQGTTPVTLQVSNKEILEVVPLLFANQPLQYTVKDRIISIERKPTEKATIADEPSAVVKQYIMRGIVVNHEGRPLTNASIYTLDKSGKRTALQAQTGEGGAFVIQ